MKLLFVIPYTPSRIRTRPYHLIKALRARGHEITLATIRDPKDDLRELTRLLGPGRIIAESLPVSRSLWNCVKALPAGRPLQADFSRQPALAGRILAALDESLPDVVHVEHLRGSFYGMAILQHLGRTAQTVPVVWDSVDCISLLFEQTRRLSSTRRARLIAGLEAGRTRKYEAMLLHEFSSTVVTSKADRKALLRVAASRAEQGRNREGTEPPVTVVENGVDLDYFHPAEHASERRQGHQYPPTIVFSGKMSYHANVTAVRNFARESLPLLRRRFPEIRFLIVGKDPPGEIRRLGESLDENSLRKGKSNHATGIFVTGTVSDIRPFLWEASAAVAPIEYGAGIQNKVLEAMSCGVPVVASRQAVSALDVRAGTDCLVADTPEEFASALAAVLQQPRLGEDLAAAGRAYVERCHDWLASARKLEMVYQDARRRTATQRRYRSAS